MLDNSFVAHDYLYQNCTFNMNKTPKLAMFHFDNCTSPRASGQLPPGGCAAARSTRRRRAEGVVCRISGAQSTAFKMKS